MGASGAGKTTLLNILSCRLKPDSGGKLTANNLAYTYKNFGNFANYIMQHDILMETLTVRETLEFAAKLKLDLPENERRFHIDKLASSIKLEKCMDTLIGGAVIKGISGG
jgi:ABC-type multidrug transport system ATPase subunit